MVPPGDRKLGSRSEMRSILHPMRGTLRPLRQSVSTTEGAAKTFSTLDTESVFAARVRSVVSHGNGNGIHGLLRSRTSVFQEVKGDVHVMEYTIIFWRDVHKTKATEHQYFSFEKIYWQTWMRPEASTSWLTNRFLLFSIDMRGTVRSGSIFWNSRFL